MKLEIPVEVDLNGIDSIVDEIKCLQTYKLFEGDDMVLVNLDDVAEILINHIEAKRKSEPQRKSGKWVHLGGSDWCCSACGHVICTEGSWEHPLERGCLYCEHCGADMRGEQDGYNVT